MQKSKLMKNTPGSAESSPASLQLAPITGIPFAAPELREHGETRVNPLFFTSLLTTVGQKSVVSSEFYPWDAAPLVWFFDTGKVLSGTEAGVVQPLDVTGLLNLSTLEAYAEITHEVAEIIYAGETERAGVRRPVLAIIAGIENFLRESHPNLQGPENQELTLGEYLAERTGGSWEAVRSYASWHSPDSSQQELFDAHTLASISALAYWHDSHRFDPATGQETTVSQAGWSRTTARGSELFPRTDPAVITAVTAQVEGQEKLLLGSARAWEEHRYSTFAGFVEAGETLENAVAREVYEECGAIVEALAYRASQPWPFPRSLMLGYTARISNPESVQADGDEIRSIRWFTRDELRAAEASGEVVLPSSSSISRKLIDDWLHQAHR